MRNENMLIPYVGVGDIRFGETEKDVLDLLGTPIGSSKTYFGKQRFEYSGISILFEDGFVCEITASPEIKLVLDGHNLFEEKNILDFLSNYDNSYVECEGWYVFPNLGISISNFEHGDQTPIVSVGRKGYWDDLL